MADNTDALFALLDRRICEAEKQFAETPEVKRFIAKSEHMLMCHGSGELCDCPEWQD